MLCTHPLLTGSDVVMRPAPYQGVILAVDASGGGCGYPEVRRQGPPVQPALRAAVKAPRPCHPSRSASYSYHKSLCIWWAELHNPARLCVMSFQLLATLTQRDTDGSPHHGKGASGKMYRSFYEMVPVGVERPVRSLQRLESLVNGRWAFPGFATCCPLRVATTARTSGWSPPRFIR